MAVNASTRKGRPIGEPYAIELFDPYDDKTLCYFKEAGSWVRSPKEARRYSVEELALGDYSLIQMHFLHARIVNVDKLNA